MSASSEINFEPHQETDSTESGNDPENTWSISDDESDTDSIDVTYDTNYCEGEIRLALDEYHREEMAADAWLVKNPEGSRLLYPNLFIVEPAAGGFAISALDDKKPCTFFALPREVRDLIYECYFEQLEDDDRLNFTSENVEFKYWLSTSLPQSSRQLRHEALASLISSRIFTTEWLTVIPRFSVFLGESGRALVRYFDLWDWHDLRTHHGDEYQQILACLTSFPNLQDVRIVLSRKPDINQGYQEANCSDAKGRDDRVQRQTTEIDDTVQSDLVKSRIISVEQLTLAYMDEEAYVECDQLDASVRETIAQMRLNETTSLLDLHLRQRLDKHFGIHTVGCTPEVKPGTAWKDTDELPDKTVPLYNLARELQLSRMDLSPVVRDRWSCFPLAIKSKGDIIRDCGICYCKGEHCGYHNLPMDPDDDEARGSLYAQSYLGLKQMAENFAKYLDDGEEESLIHRALVIHDHIGWPSIQGVGYLKTLDETCHSNMGAGTFDMDEVKIWDIVCRELRSRMASRKIKSALISVQY